jgi:hypothetical protein
MRLGAHDEVEVEGEVLAELEAFEAVDDQRFRQGGAQTLEKQAMTAEALDLAHDPGSKDPSGSFYIGNTPNPQAHFMLEEARDSREGQHVIYCTRSL